MKKKILWITLIILLLIGGSIYYVFNKPHRDIAGSDPDFTISAVELLKAFEENEAEANAKYLDKIIQVSGSIQNIETTVDNNLNITLNAENDMSTVSCSMLASEKEKAKKLAAGEQVIIKGLCTGMLMDVVLTNCTIIK